MSAKFRHTRRDRIGTAWANRVRAAATARSGQRVHDAWVEAEIDKSWMAAYRLVPGQFGQPVIAEIRVFPHETTEGRPAGQWSAEVLGVYAKPPQGGITAEVIRKVPVAEHRQVGRDFAEWVGGVAPDRAPVGSVTIKIPRSAKMPTRGAVNAKLTGAKFKAVLPARRSKRGRPPIHGDRFFAELARDYAQRVAEGSPHPTKDLAEKRGISRVRMRALLSEARKRKLLSGSGRGRSGGTITNRAEGVLAGE
jgi:hypothetical protein